MISTNVFNDLQEYINPIIDSVLLQLGEYKDDLEQTYNIQKTKTHNTYNKLVSYLVVFLFFYYMKDVFFYLLRKFDTLLTS